MKTRAFLLLLGFFVVFGCGPDEEDDICTDYCEVKEDCANLGGQMFSWSECQRTCTESMERSESIGCGERAADYYDCLIDIPCADWTESGDKCALEEEYLAKCQDGTL